MSLSPLFAQLVQGWRSLITRVILLNLLVGGGLLLYFDAYHDEQFKELLYQDLQQRLELQSAAHRRLFDQEIQWLARSGRLVTTQSNFTGYMDAPEWGDRVIDHFNPPKWMPPVSVVRSFLNASDVLLLDGEGNLREVYHHFLDTALDQEALVDSWLHPGSILGKLSHTQAYLTQVDGQPYVIGLAEARDSAGRNAGALALIARIDSAFLKRIRGLDLGDTVIGLIGGPTHSVVATSDGEQIPVGATAADLAENFLMVGKSFFDYGTSDLDLQFTSFISTDRVERLTAATLQEGRRQRYLLATTLIGLFTLISLWGTWRVKQVLKDVCVFTRTFNGAELDHSKVEGDEVTLLRDHFHNLMVRVDSNRETLTEHKLALERQVRDQVEGLERAREAAEAANRAKSRFVASMSHELRTPLNAILGFAQLMAEDPGIPAGQRKNLDTINRTGEHLLAMINDILDLSRIEADRIELRRDPLDPRRMFTELAEMVRLSAEGKGLRFRLILDPHLPGIIRSDPGRLRQISINLLANAIKFTSSGEVELRVSARAEADRRQWLRVEVRDTGIGIPPERLEAIFEPFVQGAGLEQTVEGAGLGLAISRAFAERMGGTLRAESIQGAGSRFRAEIPVELCEESDDSVPVLARSLADGGDALPRPIGLPSPSAVGQADLAAVPKELVRELLDAALRLNEARIIEVVERIGVAHPETAAALRRLAERYDFGQLTLLCQQAPRTTAGEAQAGGSSQEAGAGGGG